jgi:hypothetical protein
MFDSEIHTASILRKAHSGSGGDADLVRTISRQERKR